MSYTDVFGGGVANPADVQYRAFNLTADTELQWPSSNEDQPNVVARLMAITPSGGTWTLTMPPANQAATGENSVIRNLGALSFNVVGNTGVAIATLAPGEAKYIYVTDNSTVAGTWSVFTFGTGTSGADAAALAGAGLQASASLLRQALDVTFVAAGYTAGTNDRATVIEYTGGVNTLALSPASTLGDNWFVYLTNQGSGTLTVDPDAGETIDGASTATILQGESCMIVCDGANFVTIGRGRSVSFTTTAASINIAGSGTTTLSTAQAAAQIQTYTGLLTGNAIINYGTNPGFWFVENDTTGAFTVTLRVNSSDTGVVIPAGASNVYRSDGVNLTQAVTVTSGTVTQVDTGTGLTGGPITTTGTISLANTAVGAGTYTVAGLTVDAQGRLTAAVERTNTQNTWNAGQIGAFMSVPFSTTIALNFASSNNFRINNVTSGFTLANPSGLTTSGGQSGIIEITSSSALGVSSYGSAWVTAAGARPTFSGSRTLLGYVSLNASSVFLNSQPDVRTIS